VENTVMNTVKTILLVDDDDESRVALKWFLSNFGYLVEPASSAEKALSLFDANLHDIVLTDNSMPGMCCMEMAHVIKLRSPSTPVLMYTGVAPENQSSVDLLIQKPAPILELKAGLEKLLTEQQ
jgi:DNA-binding response OmpR family regulator